MRYLLVLAAIILACLLIPRVRLFLMVLVFGVTGPDGDHAWPNPISAWKWSGEISKQRGKR